MSSKFTLPKKGFVFWPVGTGDSTTIIVKENESIFQLDLRHLEKSEDADDPAWPVVDELVRLLPKQNGKPYLSVFALTHPDEDHVLGFRELLRKVIIGEIWHTPRVFRDYEDENPLCEDAEVFHKEAHRRRQAVIANPNNVKPGDRVRIIGHDDILTEDNYKNFPRERTSIPGHVITVLDDTDVSDCFEAFVHAPFKADARGDRNETSLSLHVTLKQGDAVGSALFFGDHEYPTLKQIFELTIERENEEYLRWNLMLAAHHCSKKAMYWKEEDQNEESFKKDSMDYFETYEQSGGYIIASSNSDFTDGDGDNPPHGKARKQYEKIVDAGHFLCTHEYPSKEAPEPLKFELGDTGLSVVQAGESKSQIVTSTLASAVTAARGGTTPPQQQVGFGRK